MLLILEQIWSTHFLQQSSQIFSQFSFDFFCWNVKMENECYFFFDEHYFIVNEKIYAFSQNEDEVIFSHFSDLTWNTMKMHLRNNRRFFESFCDNLWINWMINIRNSVSHSCQAKRMKINIVISIINKMMTHVWDKAYRILHSRYPLRNYEKIFPHLC